MTTKPNRIAVAAVVVVLLVGLLAGPVALSGDPLAQHRDAALAPPDSSHPMGTDDLGRDLWSLFLFGGRWSLTIGALASVAALALAWCVGSVAGWFGDWIDTSLMTVADLFLSIPWLYLLIAARAALPIELPSELTSVLMTGLIASVSWARPARLVRGVVLAAREQGWVEAAHGFGVPGLTIFRRHVLPATYSLLATQVLILVPRFVLAEVTLSFAGAGSGEWQPTWGALFVPLKQAYLLADQWWRLLPVLGMMPVFAGLSLLSRWAAKPER